MNVTVISDEYSQDFILAAQYAASAGLKTIELRSAWNRHCLDLSPAQIGDIRRARADNGLTICVLDTFLFKGAWEEFSAHESGERTRKYVDLAAELSVPWIRIFGFWATGGPSVDALSELVLEVSDLCRSRGIGLLVENGTFTTIAEGHSLARLLERVDRKDVRALWDPANVRNGGWPEDSGSGLRALGRRIAHVHVKNPHRNGATGAMSYGTLAGGLVDWSEQLRLLAETGFEGYLSLETHARPDRVIPQSLLNFPEGDIFSDGGQTVTDTMLADLREMMHREPAYA